jgi:hypothetical protein
MLWTGDTKMAIKIRLGSSLVRVVGPSVSAVLAARVDIIEAWAFGTGLDLSPLALLGEIEEYAADVGLALEVLCP